MIHVNIFGKMFFLFYWKNFLCIFICILIGGVNNVSSVNIFWLCQGAQGVTIFVCLSGTKFHQGLSILISLSGLSQVFLRSLSGLSLNIQIIANALAKGI